MNNAWTKTIKNIEIDYKSQQEKPNRQKEAKTEVRLAWAGFAELKWVLKNKMQYYLPVNLKLNDA